MSHSFFKACTVAVSAATTIGAHLAIGLYINANPQHENATTLSYLLVSGIVNALVCAGAAATADETPQP